MCMQPLAQAWSFREFENAIVINNACADIAALQRNNPDPPTPTEKVIGRPLAARSTTVGVIGKTLPPFVTVPLLDATESRPDRIDRMLVVWTKMSQLPRQHGCTSSGIDNPTASHTALIKVYNCTYRLPVRVTQLALCHFGRTPEVASGFYREVKHVRIKFRAIDLKTRQTTLIA